MTEQLIDVVCNENTKKDCAIKLGGVFCDGYKEQQSIGVFSHFHNDHIRAIHHCIRSYDVLITHPITFEGIDALKPGMRYREQWVQQSYDTEYKFANGTVSLLKANHIPGSSQVYVKSEDKTLLYSGDFHYPDMQIKQADYLVLDSTHGDPWIDGKTERKSVKNRLFEHVMENIDSKKQIVIKVSTGTLQEIVRHFEIGYGKKMADDIEFVMHKKQEKVLHAIYQNEVNEFRDIVEYDTIEFWDNIRNNKKCIIFSHSMILDDDISNYYKIIIDQYRFTKNEAPIIPFDGGCRFNLAAHTSIDGIYDYIESVNPKYVVTDYSRSGYAKQLSKLIEQKFPNIRVEYRPTDVL